MANLGPMKLLSIFLFALAGCAAIQPVRAGPTAGLGQMAVANSVQFRPLEVLEDSRCPVLVRCVWAGRLKVRTEIRGRGWAQTRDLELGVPQAVAEYRVALIAAEPQKAAPGEIEPGAYRFTFTATGR